MLPGAVHQLRGAEWPDFPQPHSSLLLRTQLRTIKDDVLRYSRKDIIKVTAQIVCSRAGIFLQAALLCH